MVTKSNSGEYKLNIQQRARIAEKIRDNFTSGTIFKKLGSTIQAFGIDIINFYFKYTDFDFEVIEDEVEVNSVKQLINKRLSFVFKFELPGIKYLIEISTVVRWDELERL